MPIRTDVVRIDADDHHPDLSTGPLVIDTKVGLFIEWHHAAAFLAALEIFTGGDIIQREHVRPMIVDLMSALRTVDRGAAMKMTT